MAQGDLIGSALSIATNQGATQTYSARYQQTQIASPQQGSGHDLANALGLMGDSLAQSYKDQEIRAQKMGIAEAEKVVNAQTDVDMHKLSAIEMIGNQTTDKELQDNPYALVTIEKMRGGYLANQAHDDYLAWRTQQPNTLKTASEEITRYNEFMSKAKASAQGTTTNLEAFNKGFNEKHIPNQLAVASQHRTEHAIELRAIQKGTAISTLTKLVENSDRIGDEEFKTQFQAVMNDARISWMSPEGRIELAQHALKSLATTTGDYGRIQKMADSITVGTNDEGALITVGDISDISALKFVAEQTTNHIMGEKVQKARKELQGMSIVDQNKWYADKQQNDLEFYNVMLGDREKFIGYREAEDQRKAKLEARQRATASLFKQATDAIDIQMNAHMQNLLHDSVGRTVAIGKGSLPVIEVMDIDDNGNPITKKYEWTDADLSKHADRFISQITSRTDLSDSEKHRMVLQTLTFAPFEAYRKRVSDVFHSALDNATVTGLTQNKESIIKAPQQLLQTLGMYRENPNVFKKVFGEDAWSRASIIQSMSEGGDYLDGIQLYAKNQEFTQQNKDWTEQKYTEVKNLLPFSSMSGFMDLDGDTSSPDMNMGSNNGAMRIIQQQALALATSGGSAQIAVDKAKANAQGTFRVYRNTLIPMDLFDGINSAQRLAVGKDTLEDQMSYFTQEFGVDASHITVTYMPKSPKYPQLEDLEDTQRRPRGYPEEALEEALEDTLR